MLFRISAKGAIDGFCVEEQPVKFWLDQDEISAFAIAAGILAPYSGFDQLGGILPVSYLRHCS